MLCQVCQTKTAEIKIAHILNNKKLEIDLCKNCADDKGISSPLMNLPLLFGNFIAQLIGEDGLKRRKENDGRECAGCGLSWEDFEKTGLFGCDICYQSFEEDLEVVLRRIHGSNRHIGCRPRSLRQLVDGSELESMRADLQKAITNEQFERAAELRDILRDAEREIDKRGDDGILR